mgnify:CR=1 FL=1
MLLELVSIRSFMGRDNSTLVQVSACRRRGFKFDSTSTDVIKQQVFQLFYAGLSERVQFDTNRTGEEISQEIIIKGRRLRCP